MKERIYTIPITDALEQSGECIFCTLEQKIEKEQIEYALGAAMMEPEYRILSNKLGYCTRHTEKLLKSRRALPFALVHDTRIDEVIKSLESVNNLSDKKKAEALKEELDKQTKGCALCQKVNDTMQKFTETFLYLYKKEPDFKERILSGNGFCVHHFKDVTNALNKKIDINKSKILNELLDLEIKNLKRIKEGVFAFTKQFDYRNDKENVVKDAHITCAEKLSKQLERE